jgi:hypothetical protein
MSDRTDIKTRDPVRPADCFHAFVARQQEALDIYTKAANPAVFGFAARICVRVGKALYSAAVKPAECREWFAKAADFQRRFIIDGRKFAFAGAGNIDDYLELYSAAFLAGESAALIEALLKCTYTEKTHLVTARLISQMCALLSGQTVEVGAQEAAEAAALKKEWEPLPELFAAVSTQDASRGMSALEAFLAQYWSAGVEKWAKTALKSPQPDYEGKWSLMSAAACRILGRIPPINEKFKVYLPVELITP